MEKENVLVEKIEGTEREEKCGAKSAREEKGSAVRKKFKDENALLEAYGALEAEFTRRSQRLKLLERKLAVLEGAAEKPQVDGAEEKSTVLENADNVQAEVKEVTVEPAEEISGGDGEKAIAENGGGEGAAESAKSGESEVQENGSEKLLSNGAEVDGRFEAQRAEGLSGVKELSDEEIYQRAAACEGVRLRIVGDYLSSLKKSGAPLARGGTGTIVSPPAKANSVAEAGNMALLYFKGAGR